MNKAFNFNDKTATEVFSKLGFSLVAAALTMTIVPYVMGLFFKYVLPSLLLSKWSILVISELPLYLVGIPLAIYITKDLPGVESKQEKISGKAFIKYFAMCYTVTIIGNRIGSLLSKVMSGGKASNPLTEYTNEPGYISIVIFCIAAPVFEELLCRKLLIDKSIRYGEKNAMLLSAVAFALLHMNFFQFFYAFGTGLVFAYVYIRTQKLLYPILMHSFINILGGVLSPIVFSFSSVPELIQAYEQSNINLPLSSMVIELLILLYCLIVLSLLFGGLILIIRRRKIIFSNVFDGLSANQFRITFMNPGMIIFVVFCIVFFIKNLII